MAKRKLPKAPKKPRQSAGLTAWQNFDERVKNWRKKCSDIKNGQKRKQSLQKKYANGVK